LKTTVKHPFDKEVQLEKVNIVIGDAFVFACSDFLRTQNGALSRVVV
jgi:hypothetical protein